MSEKCFKDFFRAFSLFLICAMFTLSSATTANSRFLTPDTWDPILAGVDFNRYAYGANDPINNSDTNGHQLSLSGVLGDHPNDKERDKWLEKQARFLENHAKKMLKENPDRTDIERDLLKYAGEYRSLKGISYEVLKEQANKELMGQISAGVIGAAGARLPVGGFARFETSRLEVEARNRIMGVRNTPQEAAKNVHGNSLLSEKPTIGYSLTCTICGKTQRFGQTSETKPTDRYSGKFYERNNLRMDEGTAATSKPAARSWETQEIRNYFNQNGHLPPMNRGMH